MPHYNLASERTRLGLNQEQLSKKLGCGVKSICRWEKDISSMPGEKLQVAARLFGCSIDYLVDATEERTKRSS